MAPETTSLSLLKAEEGILLGHAAGGGEIHSTKNMICCGRSSRSRTAHSMSSSSLRKRSELSLLAKTRFGPLRSVLMNLQDVLLGTKLAILFPAIPIAIFAHYNALTMAWVFSLSLMGLTPLAERLSFITEQIAFYTGPTVGGLLNATCGNATELIIAVLALKGSKIELVKWSLVGSVLSNLLLVLGSSLVCGGIANHHDPKHSFDRKQADVNCGLLLLAALCHTLPLLFRCAATHVNRTSANIETADSILDLSRACSIVMLVAYAAYLFFQLKTHSKFFEQQQTNQDESDDDRLNDAVDDDHPVIGLTCALAWLAGMTLLISILSEYVVQTIEAASECWNLSVSFISIILLPIVGNAAEHAGAIIFACKNKLDITLGVALGSATQISLFVIPLSVILSWIMGTNMDLDFDVLETTSLLLAIIVTAFSLQDGTSHYLKGCILLLCYIVIGACFFVLKTPLKGNGLDLITTINRVAM